MTQHGSEHLLSLETILQRERRAAELLRLRNERAVEYLESLVETPLKRMVVAILKGER